MQTKKDMLFSQMVFHLIAQSGVLKAFFSDSKVFLHKSGM